MLVFSGFVASFPLLEQDYLEAIDRRDLESRKLHLSNKDASTESRRESLQEKKMKKLKRSGLMLDSVGFKESAFWHTRETKHLQRQI